VSGADDVVGKIETLIAFVISGVSEENTSGGLRSQFVSGFGGGIRIASATEHSQVLIGGGDSIEGKVWTGRANRLGGEAIQQICGSVEPFYPVSTRDRNLKKQGTQHIIYGAKNALGFTAMRRSVWTRHPQSPIGGEEYTR
jgi:hypothetical protein